MARVVVIGAGFGGLSAAAYLAQAGHAVTVLERAGQPGGRARVVRQAGFTFELGPSWYLMPDVFAEWFAQFGHRPADFYNLVALEPSYQVVGHDQTFSVPRPPAVFEVFERLEPGAGAALRQLLAKAEREYAEVRGGLLELDGLDWRQALRRDVLGYVLRPELARSYHGRIKRYFRSPALQQAMEFMTVFMGGSPHNIPAFYSLLAHVDMNLGGWYPMGGFGAVARAVAAVAQEQGARLEYGADVTAILVRGGRVAGVRAGGQAIPADLVVSGADYRFTETQLLPEAARSLPEAYWRRRQLSPTGLLVTLGVKGRVPNLLHHNLFFDTDWDRHFREVFQENVWSRDPLFYLCVPSKTDPGVAPAGHENLFVLAPMAAGTHPGQSELEAGADRLTARIERAAGQPFAASIVTRSVYGPEYFEREFHAAGGNAFGLSHTLTQSALLRAPLRSRRLPNLYYTGQSTNPGTGVPMVLLSGKIVSGIIMKDSRAKPGT
ncbi:MAG TPA: phytoene desaturase family protein [Candidatus Saccharimonadia bacterium]